MKKKGIRVFGTILLFGMMFFAGRGIAAIRENDGAAVDTVSIQQQAESWGLGFGAEGTQPTGNATADELKQYNAYYVGNPDEKVIYLTFDCG